VKCVGCGGKDPGVGDRESLLSADMGADTAEETKQLFLGFQAAGGHFFSDAEKGAVGGQNLHRQGPRRQPAALCRARRLTARCAGTGLRWPRPGRPWLVSASVYPSRIFS